MTPLMSIGKAFMIDSKLMQDGCLKIMDVDRVFDHVNAVIIRFSIGETGANTASRKPIGETIRVVVSTVILRCQFALAINRSSKFTAPNDQCLVEHTALLQVHQQCGCCLVCIAALRFDAVGRVSMSIPASVVKLDETNTAFGQPACEQTVVRIFANLRRLGAIHVQNALWFTFDVDQLWHAHLHAKGEFVLCDSCGDSWIIHGSLLSTIEPL